MYPRDGSARSHLMVGKEWEGAEEGGSPRRFVMVMKTRGGGTPGAPMTTPVILHDGAEFHLVLVPGYTLTPMSEPPSR